MENIKQSSYIPAETEPCDVLPLRDVVGRLPGGCHDAGGSGMTLILSVAWVSSELELLELDCSLSLEELSELKLIDNL